MSEPGGSKDSSGLPSLRSLEEIEAKPFDLRWCGESAEGEGARWWNESFAGWRSIGGTDVSGRRKFLLAIGGAAGAMMLVNIVKCIRDDDPEVSMEALQVQQQLGWNAGAVDRTVTFESRATPYDAGGQALGTEAMTGLWTALRPVQPAWVPYYVPTLFRSLADERSGSLRAQMMLVHTPAMDEAFGRGQGMAGVFGTSGAPDDVALIIDMPGPEAVALATALSARFEPVWLFDNWPHPRGVVASHAVLGAALYYRPLLEEHALAREAHLSATAASPDAGPVPSAPAVSIRTPPVFVLDSNRLAHYSDASDRFDNRYLARLPSAEALRQAGYHRVLYVRPSSQPGAQLRELDDLNDDFVAYQDHGVDVRIVAADAFQLDATLSATAAPVYIWGGSPHLHSFFWHSYGWSTFGPGHGSAFQSARPFGAASGADYRPAIRPTMFSSRTVGGLGGVGRQRPSGFGVVSVRQSGSSGHITSVGSGRSGSFGRLGGSSFG